MGGTIAEDDIKDIKLGNMMKERHFKIFKNYSKITQKQVLFLGIISRNFENKAMKFMSSHPEMVLKKRLCWLEN